VRSKTVEIEQDELDQLRLNSARLDWFTKFVEASGGMPAADTISMIDGALASKHSPAVSAQISKAMRSARIRRQARPTDPSRPSSA
jgi:hypothetical protein